MLLEVRQLTKRYRDGRLVVHAVEQVDLQLDRGRVLGLVGESGCGKTTLGRCVVRLVEPTSGQVVLDGTDLTRLSPRRLRRHRRQMQVVFQDPFLSLDPRMTVRTIVEEPLRIHGMGSRAWRRQRVDHVLEQVGLDPAMAQRFPHQLSGGQRQRVGIARALAPEPRLIVADEPVSALDVSIQAQILNLLLRVQQQGDLSLIFISHDLRVVRAISHEVAVMYLGRVVEQGPPAALTSAGLHPYTRALAAAAPVLEPDQAPRLVLEGEPPSPTRPPSGCPFHPRCLLYGERQNPDCLNLRPLLRPAGKAHQVACHEVGQVRETVDSTDG